MKESQQREPCTPGDNFLHSLYIHHSKDEDEVVEYKVPEFVLQMLKYKIILLNLRYTSCKKI